MVANLFHPMQRSVSLVKKPKVDNAVVRFLDLEEERRILAVAPEPLRTAIIISIHTGLRDGELRRLTWADVRLSERVIVVRRTKSKKDRVIPMSHTLFELLDALPRRMNSPFVIPNPETGRQYDRFNNTAWRNVLKVAGVANLRWHDLRHTFGTRLAMAGVPLVAIRDLMGHQSVQTTMRYAHFAPSNLKQAVLALDGQFFGDSGEQVPCRSHSRSQKQNVAKEDSCQNTQSIAL